MKKIAFFVAVAAAFLAPLSAIEVGKSAPDFTLTGIDGKEYGLSDFEGKYVVLEWLNFNCPFVKKHYASGNIPKLQKEWADKDVVWLAINSTSKGHKDYLDAAAHRKLMESYNAAPAHVLLDEEGEVGRKYGATTTPHMFIINPEGKVVYEGAIDSIPSARKQDIKSAENYVQAALSAAKEGRKIETAESKPYGCSVKY